MTNQHLASQQPKPARVGRVPTSQRVGTSRARAGRLYLALALPLALFTTSRTHGAAPQQLVYPRVVETGETVMHAFEFRADAAKAGAISDVRLSCECMSLSDLTEESVTVSFTPDVAGAYRFVVDVLSEDGEHPVESFRLDMDVTGVELRARPRELYVTLGELDAKREQGSSFALVDLRDRVSYEAVRIRGSVSVRPFELRANPALRGKDLVLIDEGYGHVDTENVCRRIRERGGREGWILDGGLVAWQASGRPLERLGALKHPLDVVPALAFTTLRGYADWIHVNPETDQGRAGTVAAALPQSTRVGGVGSGAFVDAVTRAAADRGDSARLLLCGADSTRYDEWRRALRGKLDIPVFFLGDGAREYIEAKRSAHNMTHPGLQQTGATSLGDTLGMYRRACSRCPE